MKEEEYRNEEEFLQEYDENKYKRPSVTNDVIIFTVGDKIEKSSRKVPKKGMQVLLIKRENYPHKGEYALPGGFVEMNEGLLDGAKRKLQNKTGIEDVYIEQLYTYGEVSRDKRTRVITVANFALVLKEKIIFNKESKGKWFWIEKKLINSEENKEEVIRTYEISLEEENGEGFISYRVVERVCKNILRRKITSYEVIKNSKEELAFDHIEILNDGINRLRNKVEYTPIAFNLLPRLFTVKELQYVYEAIMGKEIMNFRRKMGDMIVETDEKIEGKPFRPAQVFKFNENWEHSF